MIEDVGRSFWVSGRENIWEGRKERRKIRGSTGGSGKRNGTQGS
jgi:hypothetical protein